MKDRPSLAKETAEVDGSTSDGYHTFDEFLGGVCTTLSKEFRVVRTFLVDDFIMELYREVADTHGYTILDTEYDDEWNTVHNDDPDFCNIVSSDSLLSEYIAHNNDNRISYCSHDQKQLFLRLDEELTNDASSMNLSPQGYIAALSEIQCTLLALSDWIDDEEDVINNVEKYSFLQLKEMSKLMTHKK